MKLRITLEDRSYDVGVEVLPESAAEASDEERLEDVPVSVLSPPHLPDIHPDDRICRSPIAGMVVSVEVAPRQWVRRDDPVVIIEAMKMQNAIPAPVEGVVEELLVRPGQNVKAGQILCRVS